MIGASKPSLRVDICIIGAGPAGSALAIRMAQLGYQVCIVERCVFPRPHIGESISPGIWPQLELLGAADAVGRAGFWRCGTSQVKWESDTPNRREFGAGLLVDRARFDQLLLECARAHGVRVLQPAVVRTQSRRDGDWDLDVETKGGNSIIQAGFLANAGGRSARSQSRKRLASHRTLALFGYWRGSKLPREPRIEAGSEAWYWGVPLPDSTYNAIAFVDADAFRGRRAGSLTIGYHDLIYQSGLMDKCRDITLCGSVRAADATPYLDEDGVSPASIKVGDAALTLDPLSSSGVQKAVNTSLTAAVVVNTMLRRPSRTDAACAFYKSNLADSAETHRRWAAQHYAAAAAAKTGRFWQIRAQGATAEVAPGVASPGPPLSTDMPVALSPQAILKDEPCIVGDLIALKPALSHPGLDRPVAFLGGWEMPDLLRPLRDGMALGALMDSWEVPITSKAAIAKWLIDHRVLRPHVPGNSRERLG